MFEHDDDDDGRLAAWLIGLLLLGAIGGAIAWIAQGGDDVGATVTGHVDQRDASDDDSAADTASDSDDGADADSGDDAAATTTTVAAAEAVAGSFTIDIGEDAGSGGESVLATLSGRVGSQAASDAAEADALAVFGAVDNQLEIADDGSIIDDDPEITITGSASQTVLDAVAAFYGTGNAVSNDLAVSEVAAAEEADELVGNLNDLFQLEPIQFDSGSSTVQAQSTATLDAAAELLTSVADGTLTIEGHTDNQGGEATNQALSQARADAVLDYLVGAGVDAERLSAIGFGETQPIADNTTAEGRQQNRRIEFRVDEV